MGLADLWKLCKGPVTVRGRCDLPGIIFGGQRALFNHSPSLDTQSGAIGLGSGTGWTDKTQHRLDANSPCPQAEAYRQKHWNCFSTQQSSMALAEESDTPANITGGAGLRAQLSCGDYSIGHCGPIPRARWSWRPLHRILHCGIPGHITRNMRTPQAQEEACKDRPLHFRHLLRLYHTTPHQL